MFFSLVTASALAGDPVRCVASVQAPTTDCGLRGEFSVTAAARTERAATTAARAALSETLGKAVAHVLLSQPASTLDSAKCTALVADAHVNCFPDAALAKPLYCFVSLPDERCWNGEVLTVEDVGWKVFGRGTAEMCKAVDARLVGQNFTDLAVRRAECAASCLKATTVSCP